MWNSSLGCGSNSCVAKDGCPKGVCPDIVLKRYDTRPPFKVAIEDCDGPMDLTGLVVEVNIWAKAKLKAAITASETYFAFADNVGFEQLMVGDIIIMDRARLPEHMLVVAFDEVNGLVQVQRGYNATTASAWKKGTALRIMKTMNAAAQSEMVLQDIVQLDGTTLTDQIASSFLVYEWQAADTCLPGCYYLEFKLLKMLETEAAIMSVAPSVIPTFTDPSLIPSDFGCALGAGVEWVRRFPVSAEGFLIKIIDSPTMEW